MQPDLQHIPRNTYISSETKGEEWTPIGVMEKMRIYKYEPGQEFPEHVDYKSGRDVVRGGCVRRPVQTALQLYLTASSIHVGHMYIYNTKRTHTPALQDLSFSLSLSKLLSKCVTDM